MTLFKVALSGLAATLCAFSASTVLAHEETTPRPRTVDAAFIAMTPEEYPEQAAYLHPPGNVRAEDMVELFGNTVMVIDRAREYSKIESVPDHALKVVFIGRNGRYAWCAYNNDFEYFFADHIWAPIKREHRGRLSPRLDANIKDNKHSGLSPLYDGATGQTIWYGHFKRPGPDPWIDWNIGHLQERLPRAVYTLCPDFPPAEELGVGINEKQTAITYDALIAQDPGRRILRPDLITPDPTEPAQ